MSDGGHAGATGAAGVPSSLMRPSVVELRYRFLSEDPLDRFTKAAPVSITADRFDLHLASEVLAVEAVEVV